MRRYALSEAAYRLARPLLFRFDPERIHRLSMRALRGAGERGVGRWLLEIGGRKRRMRAGQSAVIAPGVIHRFAAPYEDVRLVEVSTPQVQDVVRLEDDYGRGR